MNAKVALAAMRSLIATLFLKNKIEKAQENKHSNSFNVDSTRTQTAEWCGCQNKRLK